MQYVWNPCVQQLAVRNITMAGFYTGGSCMKPKGAAQNRTDTANRIEDARQLWHLLNPHGPPLGMYAHEKL